MLVQSDSSSKAEHANSQTDIGNGCVHVFKSGYSNDFVRDKDGLIKDAVLASCSASTNFNPHKNDVNFQKPISNINHCLCRKLFH